MELSAKKTLNEDSRRYLFTELCQVLADFCWMTNDSRKEALAGAELPYFSNLPVAEQDRVLKELGIYVSICRHTLEMGFALEDSPRFTWVGLKRLGLIPPSDILSIIHKEDVIEIYNFQHCQVFRNFQFFKYCFYTIEEIFCRPWFELYERDTKITEALLASAQQLIEGRSDRIDRPTPDHPILQPEHRDKGTIIYGMRHMVRLRPKDKAHEGAFIVIEEAKFTAN